MCQCVNIHLHGHQRAVRAMKHLHIDNYIHQVAALVTSAPDTDIYSTMTFSFSRHINKIDELQLLIDEFRIQYFLNNVGCELTHAAESVYD